MCIMKKSNNLFFFGLFFLLFMNCSPESHQELPQYNPVVYSENFQKIISNDFDENQFTHYIEAGSKKWFPNKDNRKNGYYEFSPFNSSETLNVAWIVLPPINLDLANAKRLTFKCAQHHVVNSEHNDLKLFVSLNFYGNVNEAKWIELSFKKPEANSQNYLWINSGIVDLSPFSGMIHIAFKANGGSASTNAGAYMIDDIKVF